MYLSFKKFKLSASLIFPFVLVFYIISGISYSLNPSPYVLNLDFGLFPWIFVFFTTGLILFILSIGIKSPMRGGEENKIDIEFNVLDFTIISLLIFLHLYLNYSNTESIRHSAEGISGTGLVGYLYYIFKPTFSLILLKLACSKNIYISLTLFTTCLIFLIFPSSGLDAYYILVFFILRRSHSFSIDEKERQSFFTLFVFALTISAVIYSSFSNKGIEIANNIILNALQYRASVYPVSFAYFFENFFKINIIDLTSLYVEINTYRLEVIFGFFSSEPSVESLNRLNFLSTQTWDRDNQPGASPGLLTSIFISPILWIFVFPIFFLLNKYIEKIYENSNLNSFITLCFISPLFFSILASPFDFIFLLGGGQFFIIYLILNLFIFILKKKILR
jgi:hypothetical protein